MAFATPSSTSGARRRPRPSALCYRRPCRGQTIVSASSAEVAPANTLLAWISDRGGAVDPRVAPSREQNALTVSSTVPVDTELLVLPPEACLVAEDALQLTSKLLAERGKGDESAYADLIASLPPPGSAQLRSPVLWDDDKIASALEGSQTLEKVVDTKQGLLNELETLEQLPDGTTPEEYLWATAVIWQFAIDSGPVGREFGAVLMPGLSLLSASSNASVTDCVVDVGYSGFFGRNKTLTVKAKRNFEEKDRPTVFIGSEEADPVSDFVERGEVAESYPVTLKFGLAPFDAFLDDKIDIVETYAARDDQIEYDAESMQASFTISAADATLPNAEMPGVIQDLVQFMRLVCISATDAFLLESIFRNDVWYFMSAPVSRENESLVISSVVNEVEALLAEYPEGDKMSEVCGMEKSVLRKVRQLFAREENALDAKEYYQERRLKELDLLRPVDECEIVDSETGARAGRAFDDNY